MKFSGDSNKQTFEFNLDSKTFHADTITAAIDQLKSFRKTTGYPKMLEWEIKLYEWIVKRPGDEAEKLAERYLKIRVPRPENDFTPKSKEMVAKEIGFTEPYPGDC